MKNIFLVFILMSSLIACETKHIYKRQDIFIRDGRMHENVTEILITGLVIDKYPNGQKKSEENYVNGSREGLYSVWYPNGQKASEQSYINGKEESLAIAWYESGQMRIKGNFINGNKEGLWTTWYTTGEKSSEINFVNGHQTSIRQWDENGKEINNQVH